MKPNSLEHFSFIWDQALSQHETGVKLFFFLFTQNMYDDNDAKWNIYSGLAKPNIKQGVIKINTIQTDTDKTQIPPLTLKYMVCPNLAQLAACTT